MEPESGDWTVLTKQKGAGAVHRVEWSPDGTRLFFDRVTDVPRGIFSVPAIGGDERLVVEGAQSPDPLPDGSLLVVKLDAERRFQIVRRLARQRAPEERRAARPRGLGRPRLARVSRTARRSSCGGASPARRTRGGRRLHADRYRDRRRPPFLPDAAAPAPVPPAARRHARPRAPRGRRPAPDRLGRARRTGVETLLSFSARPRYLAEGAARHALRRILGLRGGAPARLARPAACPSASRRRPRAS